MQIFTRCVCYCCLILIRTGTFSKPTLYKVSWTSIICQFLSCYKWSHRQAQQSRPVHSLKFLAAKTPKIYINKICVFFHKILCNIPYLNGYIPNRNKLRNTSATAQNTILHFFPQSYRASWYYQSFITNWCTRELL